MPLPPYIHRDKQQPNTPKTANATRPSTQANQDVFLVLYPLSSIPFLQAPPPPPPPASTSLPKSSTALKAKGVELAYLTLHVGLGTFQPVRADRTEDIRLHAEPYTLPASTAAAINKAVRESRRIIAVGTTTTRTLEHIARESERTGQPIAAHSGSTSLFLSPGLNDDFKLVQGLLTNFHLPNPRCSCWSAPSPEGKRHSPPTPTPSPHRYRFFSYGDCMLIT